MNICYSDLVKGMLTKQYDVPFPTTIKERDFQTAIQLFTELAVSSSTKTSDPTHRAKSPPLRGKKVSQESQSLERATEIETIKEFVKEHADQFWEACNTGLHFSMLASDTAKKALEKALCSIHSIIVLLLTRDDSAVWLAEEELVSQLGDAFKHLNTSELWRPCRTLNRAYICDNDRRAGYYLLWLIKHVAGCDFEMPPQDTFDESSAKNVLTQFISSDSFILKDPVIFLEILLSNNYQDLLGDNCLLFVKFAVHKLQSIPMAACPNKGCLITRLLYTVTSDQKTVIAEGLASSIDSPTSELGQHILNALEATSMTAAIPHFYALTKLLPNFNSSDIIHIFGRPFAPFRENHAIYRHDSPFTRRLAFNDNWEVFIHGDLMIGVYDPHAIYEGQRVPPHLLAYNMKTEQMEWGLPLTPVPLDNLSLNSTQTPLMGGTPQIRHAKYNLNRVGEVITLQFDNQNSVHYIDPSSGEIKTSIVLPHKKRAEFDCLHLTPNDFGYQIVHFEEANSRKLIGGEISDSELTPAFEIETPEGFFLPLSTHVGFLDDCEDKLILFNPTGESVAIGCCLSVRANGNTLYLIEANPSDESTCKLTIRTMTEDDRVVTAPEKTIILETKAASIDYIYNNRDLILSKKTGFFNNSLIFVSLDDEKIVYSEHQFRSDPRHGINTATGDLWTWDPRSEEIWKISSTEPVLMGHIDSEGGGRRATLLHVDENDHLYFAVM